MTRYVIFGDEELSAFSQQFIHDDCMVKLPEVNDEPTVDPRDGEIGIYTILFEQLRLKLPLDLVMRGVKQKQHGFIPDDS